jgi:hypothetical protein
MATMLFIKRNGGKFPCLFTCTHFFTAYKQKNYFLYFLFNKKTSFPLLLNLQSHFFATFYTDKTLPYELFYIKFASYSREVATNDYLLLASLLSNIANLDRLSASEVRYSQRGR